MKKARRKLYNRESFSGRTAETIADLKIDKRPCARKKVALASGIISLNLRNTIDFLIIKVYNQSIVKLKWGKSGELFSRTGSGIVILAGACIALCGRSNAVEPII